MYNLVGISSAAAGASAGAEEAASLPSATTGAIAAARRNTAEAAGTPEVEGPSGLRTSPLLRQGFRRPRSKYKRDTYSRQL